MAVSEEEQKSFLKNEEKLWDLAAITIASSIVSRNQGSLREEIAELSYGFADALMIERRKRLKEPRKF